MEKKDQKESVPAVPNGCFSFVFTENEIKALSDLMRFAGSAAALLANQEATKGSENGMQTMLSYVKHSNYFNKILIDSFNIGEPKDGHIH